MHLNDVVNNTIIPNPLGFEVVTQKSKKLLNFFYKNIVL